MLNVSSELIHINIKSYLKSNFQSVLHSDPPPTPRLAVKLSTKPLPDPPLHLPPDLPPEVQQELPSHRPKTNFIFNNKDLCRSSLQQSLLATESNQKTLVIVVLTARPNIKKRNLIRETYGSIKSINNVHILAIVFMLGTIDGPGQEIVEFSTLEAERVQFHDLIMGDFVDTYRNLTRKSIMAYEWLTSFCQEAEIVVKTDDDVLINIFKLAEELNALSSSEIKAPTFRCAVHYHEKAVTDQTSRFHILLNEFPNDTFPEHCAGLGYVTNMAVIRRISDEISSSFLGRVSTHEDVFMTGVVPHKINSKSENEPIKRINRRDEWVSYDLETQKTKNAEFLLKLFQQPANETINFDEFRKRFERTIFYLFTHNLEFEERYRRFWQIIVNDSQKGV